MKKEDIMDKKRFSLGVSDLYSLAISETAIESTPAIKAVLTEEVDMDRLSDALSSAHECFPIFATTLEYADGKFTEIMAGYDEHLGDLVTRFPAKV